MGLVEDVPGDAHGPYKCCDEGSPPVGMIRTHLPISSQAIRLTAELSGGANPWLTLELAQSTVKYERNC